jgi:hypothetical protein
LAGDYLTLLSPASLFGINRWYFWLERGIEERGGEAPSHILSPSQTKKNRVLRLNLFERGIKGVSVINGTKQTESIVPPFANSASMPYS